MGHAVTLLTHKKSYHSNLNSHYIVNKNVLGASLNNTANIGHATFC